VELLQLRYFRALAEREHLTKTAQDLLVSAPTLSATITRLEKELGIVLFDRVGRNIHLNENGRILLRYVNEIFNSLQNAQTELKDANNQSDNRITLATTAESLWTEGIHAFLKENPTISVSHSGIKLDKLAHPSLCTQYDFIITALRDLSPYEWNHEILIHDDQPVLVFNRNHPFCSRESIDLIEAKDEHFVVLSRGYSSRRWFDELCAAAGFNPHIVIECDYLLRSEMIASGYGLALSSVLGMKANILGGFCYVKVDKPVVPRIQAIHWNKNRRLSQAGVIFKDFMLEYFRNYDLQHSRCQ
jgi:DNA-binding transcriptional LysR family regulator